MKSNIYINDCTPVWVLTPSVALEGTGSQSRKGLAAAAPGSLSTPYYEPERTNAGFWSNSHINWISEIWTELYLLSEVDKVVRLIYEEQLQCRASQVVASQMNFSELGQRPFKIKPDSWKQGSYLFSAKALKGSSKRLSHLCFEFSPSSVSSFSLLPS